MSLLLRLLKIRELNVSASPRERVILIKWAAYFEDTDLVLELLRTVPPTMLHPGTLWLPLLSDARKQPAFIELMREFGLVDYWRAFGWPDYCRATAGDAFECQ